MSYLPRLLLAAALAFVCLPATAQEQSPLFKCASTIEFMRVVRELEKIPEAKVEHLEGVEAEAFMAFFNEQEPATDYKADLVVFVIGPAVGTITMVRGDRACLLRQPLPEAAIKGMLMFIRQKVGQPA